MFFNVSSREFSVWYCFWLSCCSRWKFNISLRFSSASCKRAFLATYSWSSSFFAASKRASSFFISSSAEENCVLFARIFWFNSAFRMLFCSNIDFAFCCSTVIRLDAFRESKIVSFCSFNWISFSRISFSISLSFSVNCCSWFCICFSSSSASFWLSIYSESSSSAPFRDSSKASVRSL